MPTPVTFDPAIGRQFIKYARLVVGRGYVHNTLRNMVMRVPHPDFPHGLACASVVVRAIAAVATATANTTTTATAQAPHACGHHVAVAAEQD